MLQEAGLLWARCANEREKLMGFGSGYTRSLEVAKPKTDCWTDEDRRSDAIGNSCHCIVVGHLVSHAFATKPAAVCDATQFGKRCNEIERVESEWLVTWENMDVVNYDQEVTLCPDPDFGPKCSQRLCRHRDSQSLISLRGYVSEWNVDCRMLVFYWCGEANRSSRR